MLEQVLIILLREMKGVGQPQAVANLRHPTVVRAQDYIDKHFGHDLNVGELSERFHVNRSYLSTLFKRSTGMTLTDYIHHKRVAAARELLVETSDPVWKIAQQVGFADVTYIARIFRRYTGTLPHAVRSSSSRSSVV